MLTRGASVLPGKAVRAFVPSSSVEDLSRSLLIILKVIDGLVQDVFKLVKSPLGQSAITIFGKTMPLLFGGIISAISGISDPATCSSRAIMGVAIVNTNDKLIFGLGGLSLALDVVESNVRLLERRALSAGLVVSVFELTWVQSRKEPGVVLDGFRFAVWWGSGQTASLLLALLRASIQASTYPSPLQH